MIIASNFLIVMRNVLLARGYDQKIFFYFFIFFYSCLFDSLKLKQGKHTKQYKKDNFFSLVTIGTTNWISKEAVSTTKTMIWKVEKFGLKSELIFQHF